MPHNRIPVVYEVGLPSRDGFDLRAYIVDDPDFDATTSYAAAEFADLVEAWKRDEWQGVGLIVEASRAGTVLADASIWGMEYGDINGKHVQPIEEDGTDNTGYLNQTIADAISEAQSQLARLGVPE